jgi:plastocyanin
MRYRSLVPVLTLGFLFAVSALGQHHAMAGKDDYEPPNGGDPGATPAGCLGVSAKVTLSSTVTAFSPATITVDAGEPVCWTWTGMLHNVRADDGSFTSGPASDTGNFKRTFNTPGTYGYHCQVHGNATSGMRGVVVVRGAAAEGPGKLDIASSTYSVTEGIAPLTVSVARVGGSDGVATVKYATANGTAKAGKDFTARTGTLRWDNGDQNPKTIQVPIKNDTAKESAEGFSIKLSKATGATIGVSSAAVTITDDDSPSGCAGAISVPAELRASGQSAGEIRLTWGDESGAATFYRIERRQKGGAFEEIAVVPSGVNSFTDSGLPGDSIFHYRVRAEGADGVSAFSTIAAGATDGLASPCDDSGKALCLKDGRFEATVEWRAFDDSPEREAKRVLLPESPGSGLFSLSSRGETELLVNVLDGCAINNHYWLYFAAVTDVEFTVKVRDTQTGRTWLHLNPGGNIPAPVRDVDAFATCR